MHGDFKHYKIDPEVAEGFDIQPIQEVIPPELWNKIDKIATVEDDEIIDLVIEGVARVVQDRLANLDKLKSTALERRARNIAGHQYAATADIHIVPELSNAQDSLF